MRISDWSSDVCSSDLLAMWFFILAELAVFGILILAFAVAQALQAERFQAGRQALDASTGLVLTLSLLTAGWCAAQALARARQGRGGATLLLCAADRKSPRLNSRH